MRTGQAVTSSITISILCGLGLVCISLFRRVAHPAYLTAEAVVKKEADRED
jgi:hypothetical protein